MTRQRILSRKALASTIAWTQIGKAMAKICFCNFLQHDVNAIVVYNGMTNQKKLANFHGEHWKDTFPR